MGLVCPLVLGVMISVTLHWSSSETLHLASGIQAPTPSPEFQAAGSSNPREIRAERTLPWEAGNLVLILHPVCLLGDLGQVTLPLWAELLDHTVGWRQGTCMLAGAPFAPGSHGSIIGSRSEGSAQRLTEGGCLPWWKAATWSPLGVSRAVFASFAAAAGGAPIRRHADRAGQIH